VVKGTVGLYRAVVLTLFLMRRNESQAVAAELFGCSQSSVSRILRRLRPLAESGIADRWASHLRRGGPGMLADLGYLGADAITGTRKPRGADLTDVQRACNKAINSTRAAVERAIAYLVNWKVLDSGWRGRLTDFPEVLRTVTGLEIYRTWG
jgi:hypothetical protein